MSNGGFDHSVQQQAQVLANGANFDLTAHTTDQYDLLLCSSVSAGIEEDSPEFENVAGRLFNHEYRLSNPDTRLTFAQTTLQVIHVLGRTVGPVEEYSEIPPGTLAKIKVGDSSKLSLMQIAYLGDELGVPISLLCEDFSDRPEVLKEELVAVGVLSLGSPTKQAPDNSCVNEGPMPKDDPQAKDPQGVLGRPGTTDAPEEGDMEDSTRNEFENQEVVWESDTIALIGDRTFDISSKELRPKIAGHIRAAKGEHTLGTILENAAPGRANGWMSGLTKAHALITKKELTDIAAFLDVSVFVLLTGQGLDPAKMVAPGGNSKKNVLVLPVVSDTEMQEYFHSRIKTQDSSPAEGVDMSELMKLAMGDDDVDWASVWFHKIAQGAEFKKSAASIALRLKPTGNTVKVLFMRELYQMLWPLNE